MPRLPRPARLRELRWHQSFARRPGSYAGCGTQAAVGAHSVGEQALEIALVQPRYPMPSFLIKTLELRW
ncbi:hypothetical protein GCM10011348_08740 [Marinobacterium nitratireducens]|uniref:Uncharacterized protein n=1 Tax=Marinobacterium nitratireducens TaxID=518897 RepID=A0A917Z9Q8_9GAMM|nr:hypothetical protein GCM10011348_08740 [Marinobacterium nitratireducens]